MPKYSCIYVCFCLVSVTYYVFIYVQSMFNIGVGLCISCSSEWNPYTHHTCRDMSDPSAPQSVSENCIDKPVSVHIAWWCMSLLSSNHRVRKVILALWASLIPRNPRVLQNRKASLGTSEVHDLMELVVGMEIQDRVSCSVAIYQWTSIMLVLVFRFNF